MGQFGRYLGNRASAFLMIAVCTACGSSDKDTIEFTGGAGGIGTDAGANGGNGGSSNVDAGGGTAPCEVAFISPASSDGGVLTLGAAEDLDGTSCGEEFSTSVLVTSTGSQVKLFVNGNSNSSLEQAVTNLTASFASVQLDNRGATANTLRAEATMADGRKCDVTLATQVYVDCDGPSCAIAQPANDREYLNASDDLSDTDPELQTTVEVETDGESAGQDVRLTLDGDLEQQRDAQVVDEGGQGVARFTDITLDDGEHSVQAQCRDQGGNVANSLRKEFTVDTEACVPDFTTAFPATITPLADTEGGTAGIQLVAAGTTSGTPAGDCTEIRVAECDDLEGDFNDLTTPFTSFSELATLPLTTGAVELCARARDRAGNEADDQISLNVRVEAPQVAIATPLDEAEFNIANDLTGSNGTCEVAFTVACSELNADVEIVESNTVRGTATCLANGASGLATFPTVSLPTRNDGTPLSITARQSILGLVGTSAAIDVVSDCQAPALSFNNTTQTHCGNTMSLSGDDVDSGTAGLQFDIGVLHDGVSSVQLRRTFGTTEQAPIDLSTGVGSSVQFSATDLGGPGNVTLMACASDGQGNEGCTAPCPFEILAAPAVAITAPVNGDVLTATDDCDGVAGGLQIEVSGTTDAANNSTVNITFGANPVQSTTVSAGAFSLCVPALIDGPNQIVEVEITDAINGPPEGVATVTVGIDTAAPTQTISRPTFDPIDPVTQRRQGLVTFHWTSVADEGGGALASYEMRCFKEPINDEGEWNAARPHTINSVPQAGGNPETEVVGGFRVGTTEWCAIRGRDLGGALTQMPVDPSVEVIVPFLQRDFTVPDPGVGITFAGVAGVGDINGDSQNDFVYSFNNQLARIFFGGSALEQTGDVDISGVAGSLGAVLAPLGDINNDDRPDFAVTARTLADGGNAQAGSVYIFFGRTAGNGWPSTINTLSPRGGCGADLCFHSNNASSNLGADVASGDFNGDGELDVVIGSRTFNSATPGAIGGAGRVYVVLGGNQLAVASGTSIDLPGGNPNGFIIDPPADTSNFGISLAAVGAGSDSRADLVIGANGQTNGNPGRTFFVAGEAYAGTGLVNTAVAPVEIDNGASADHGNPVRALGDFNGDSSGDVAVGTNFATGGVARVLMRGASNFTPATFVDFTNNDGDDDWATFIGSGLHPSLGLVGDLDGDGFGELLAGSLDALPGGGTAEIFYGEAGITTASCTNRCTRATANFRFAPTGQGRVLPNFVGDIDGDGFDDVAVLHYGASVTDTLTLLY